MHVPYGHAKNTFGAHVYVMYPDMYSVVFVTLLSQICDAFIHMHTYKHMYIWMYDVFSHVCDATHSNRLIHTPYGWTHGILSLTWRIHMCDLTHFDVCHDWCTCRKTNPVHHVCAVTHSRGWPHSLICVPWLIYMRVWHIHTLKDRLQCILRVTWHIHVYDPVWPHSLICVPCLIYVCVEHIHTLKDRLQCILRVTWRIHMCDVTHPLLTEYQALW